MKIMMTYRSKQYYIWGKPGDNIKGLPILRNVDANYILVQPWMTRNKVVPYMGHVESIGMNSQASQPAPHEVK
jgi:hypothetical protein